MRKMLVDIAAHRPDQRPDIYFAAGYAQAKAVTALLEAAVAGGDLSRAGIVAAQRRLGTVDLEGLFGNYGYGAPRAAQPDPHHDHLPGEPGGPGRRSRR